MDEHDIDRRIRNVLRSLARLAVDPDRLTDQDDLYDAGLKSLTAVQLLLGLEDEFEIEFPEALLHRGAFATVGRISEAVAALANGRKLPSRAAR